MPIRISFEPLNHLHIFLFLLKKIDLNIGGSKGGGGVGGLNAPVGFVCLSVQKFPRTCLFEDPTPPPPPKNSCPEPLPLEEFADPPLQNTMKKRSFYFEGDITLMGHTFIVLLPSV